MPPKAVLREEALSDARCRSSQVWHSSSPSPRRRSPQASGEARIASLKGKGSGITTADLASGAATSRGTARFSHLGRNTYSLDITFTPTGANTFGLEGTATLTAANGDRVFSAAGTATASGIGVGETARQHVVFTITGGTGRFADAGGTLTAEVETTAVSLVGTALVSRDTFQAQGRISP